MSAVIRSTTLAVNVDGASRDDLVVGTPVTLNSMGSASTWAWTLVFVPEDSTATFSGLSSSASPGTFTPDLEGAYLVRLVTDIGTEDEDTQYVRLRVVTDFAGLRLVAAGERRDGTGVIPVDVSPAGWANEQNANLKALEDAIRINTGFFRSTLLSSGQCAAAEVLWGGAQFRLAGTDLPSALSYRIAFVHYVTEVGLTGTWTLYDVTNQQTVATGSTTSLSPVGGTVALTRGNGVGEIKDAATIYEVRLGIAGGADVSDVYVVGSIVLEGV